MSDARSRRTVILIAGTAMFGPALLMLWNARIGALALGIGLLVAFRVIRMLRDSATDHFDVDALHARQLRGRTIFVRVVDAHGNPFDAETQRRLLADAELTAGPRDSVVAVRHPVT